MFLFARCVVVRYAICSLRSTCCDLAWPSMRTYTASSSRSTVPHYGFFILNRNGLEYVQEFLTPESEVQVGGEFILYEGGQDAGAFVRHPEALLLRFVARAGASSAGKDIIY